MNQIECIVRKTCSRHFPGTDLNADNVLFLDGTDPESIQEHLDRSTQVIEGDFELKGARYPIMRSQPIPSTFHWDDPGITVELYSFCLIDFGSGKHSRSAQYRLPSYT